MRVTVKQRHIDQALALRAATGGKIHARACPIALAMKEQAKIPIVASATVGYASAELFMGGRLVGRYHTSTAAREFITRFDRGETVKPRTFMLHAEK